MGTVVRGCVAALLVAVSTSPTLAQTSKSAALAKQLAAALEAGKIESIAAKDGSAPDVYVAAFYTAGVQLLVVCGSYSAPALLDARIAKQEYREVYLDLTGASTLATRILVEDFAADGLKPKREDSPLFDTVTIAGKSMAFDGDWKKQKISEDEYMKAYTAADERYAKMLQTLLSAVSAKGPRSKSQ